MAKLKSRRSDLTRVSTVLGIDGLDQLFEAGEDQIKWDFNLSRLPYFVPGDKKQDRFRNIELRETIDIDGKTVTAVWEVRCDPKLGLPGSFDRDVWIGIQQIVNEITCNGRQPVPEIIDLGSAYGFLKRIGKAQNGQYVRMLRDSIERLATTGCITKGAFNCPGSGGYLHLGEVFHLIRSWGFKGEPRTGGGSHETTWIKLDSLIRQNLDTFYVSLLRVSYLHSLKGEITKSLYPLLSYRFWKASSNGHTKWKVRWDQLANYIGLKHIDSLKHAKDRFKSAFQELKDKQYISCDSHWADDQYVFYPGLEHVREHQMKVQARDRCLTGRKGVLKKTLAVAPVTPVWHGSHADPDPRQSEIGYQVFRLKRGQQLKSERLDKFGITTTEVYEAARELDQCKDQ